MSYDIYIFKRGSNSDDYLYLKSSHTLGGGTQAIGGTDRAWLNVTYNYAPVFKECFHNSNGIHFIEEQSVKETLPKLEEGAKYLEEKYPITEIPTEDYWKPTPLNVKKAILNLITIAKLAIADYPDEDLIWRIY